MKVLVCGGRDYSDKKTLFDVLDAIHTETTISMVINGGATGADSLASEWSCQRRVSRMVFRADWKKYGASAGPIRNAEMLAERPDLVVAFPGGAGTRDMISKTKSAGIELLEVN